MIKKARGLYLKLSAAMVFTAVLFAGSLGSPAYAASLSQGSGHGGPQICMVQVVDQNGARCLDLQPFGEATKPIAADQVGCNSSVLQIWQDVSYGGAEICFNVSEKWIGQYCMVWYIYNVSCHYNWNDAASSIKAGSGIYRACLYWNSSFGGVGVLDTGSFSYDSSTGTHYSGYLGNYWNSYYGKNWNDEVSSLAVLGSGGSC